MEERPKKQPKEGKGESNNKRPNHGEKRKGNSGPGADNVRRKRLDGQTVGYFRRVSDMLSEGFNEEEEKGKSVLGGRISC